ncbi:MAG: Guanylate kinase [Chlamydiae bacterium]|nr:Guanylate kinase [Chlamydiota bacterium]
MKKLGSSCKTLNKKNHGVPFILSAPAGTGKTTLVKKLTSEADHIVRNVSYTTRSPRGNEENGKDYHFISFQDFERKIKKGDFLEYAEVFGNFYGTCKESVNKLLVGGFDAVLILDTQGALKIKEFLEGVYIFMSPPSLEELESRLINRKTEKPEDLIRRLSWAHHEIEQAKYYDYHIVNCQIEKAYQALKSIFHAEKFKIRK